MLLNQGGKAVDDSVLWARVIHGSVFMRVFSELVEGRVLGQVTRRKSQFRSVPSCGKEFADRYRVSLRHAFD